MELIKTTLNIDFMGQRRIWFFISGTLVLISIISFITKGFNYGVDFTGGTEIQIKLLTDKKVSVGEVRDVLGTIELAQSVVQEFGDTKSGNDFLIRLDNQAKAVNSSEKDILEKLKTVVPSTSSFAFKGADDAYINFSESQDLSRIEESINSLAIAGLEVESVAQFGKKSGNEYVVKFFGVAKKVESALKEKFGKNNVEILRVEEVGPKVGKELREKGLYALLIAFLLILIYVAFRFDFKFAPGAVLCLIHDTVITAGVFSLFQIQFDLTIVAALLTIIGYSINDTIVIYDRIRDNMAKFKYKSLTEIFNLSINQTLSRTILTSLTVLFVTLVLLFFGGRMIRDFALAFTIGIIAGSYSTIYVASALTIVLDNLKKQPAEDRR